MCSTYQGQRNCCKSLLAAWDLGVGIPEHPTQAFPACSASSHVSGMISCSVGHTLMLQIFADQRYQRHDKRDKLPAWITTHLKDSHLNLSADMLLHVAREFMRSMAQPYDKMAVGKSLLTQAQVNSLVTAEPTNMMLG